MTVSLTSLKALKIYNACVNFLAKSQSTIRQVAEVIGILVASFPGVEMGPFYYRQLQNDKGASLKNNYGNYDAHMSVSQTACGHLQWWVENVETTFKRIDKGKPTFILKTVPSTSGWGGHIFMGDPSADQWHPSEAHIYILTV